MRTPRALTSTSSTAKSEGARAMRPNLASGPCTGRSSRPSRHMRRARRPTAFTAPSHVAASIRSRELRRRLASLLRAGRLAAGRVWRDPRAGVTPPISAGRRALLRPGQRARCRRDPRAHRRRRGASGHRYRLRANGWRRTSAPWTGTRRCDRGDSSPHGPRWPRANCHARARRAGCVRPGLLARAGSRAKAWGRPASHAGRGRNEP